MSSLHERSRSRHLRTTETDTKMLTSRSNAIPALIRGFAAALLVLPLAVSGCSKEEDSAKKDDAKAEKKKDDKPSLMLSNDTEACRAALKCCEERVKLKNDGKATPEDINLSCSGVGMAADDTACGEFKKGYVMEIESLGKPVPDACK